jgi:hypothetical protein
VCKADGLLGAAVVLVLMREHARSVTAKIKVPALAPAVVDHSRAWT